jgi:arylsulfatase A-like enzyme
VRRSRPVAALLSAVVLALPATLPPPAGAAASAAPGPQGTAVEPPLIPRPDIIVIYVDDVPPLDGRLWTAERTPSIQRWIIGRGLTFSNAISEAPLCCPARANLLTGLHTHNNGVTRNEASLLDPGVTIASELQDAGYRTAWIGKYLNRYMSMRGARRLAHEAAWDEFDPMSGGSYGYYRWPKGARGYIRPRLHSLRLVRRLAVRELRAAPLDRPLFAVLSTYAGHAPNIPLPELRGAPACADIAPWKPDNLGARAAHDKPAFLRRWARRQAWRVPASGVPLVRLCEDMLGVDRLVGQVVREQRRRGRLDDTLLVLTSDNGFQLGEFGIRDKKLPWATSVVLAMAWPRGMGVESRETAFPASNIDLAPTFCDIAGCTMGPYPTGQQGADGVSLVPVMVGEPHPARTALLTVMPEGHPVGRVPSWSAVTTYQGDPLGRWHHIRWEGGRTELYDLEADPLELHDVVGDPANARVVADLERLRLDLLAEGAPAPSQSPEPVPL